MYQHHLPEIDSTQRYLLRNLDYLSTLGDDPILISTDRQTAGQGRRGQQWHHLHHGLALSFTLDGLTPTTWTPLAIALAVRDFVKHHWGVTLYLKWPNDLLMLTGDGRGEWRCDSGNAAKCGGILCQSINNSRLAVGIGINLGEMVAEDRLLTNALPAAAITSIHLYSGTGDGATHAIWARRLCLAVSDSITTLATLPLNQRVETRRHAWLEATIHRNTWVTIREERSEQHGQFIDLGPLGEATLLTAEGSRKRLISGTLRPFQPPITN
jgi:biotin-(acetyl-CoA carboxylase) ligase